MACPRCNAEYTTTEYAPYCNHCGRMLERRSKEEEIEKSKQKGFETICKWCKSTNTEIKYYKITNKLKISCKDCGQEKKWENGKN